MSLSLVDNIFDAYRDPKNRYEDLFYGFRKQNIDEGDVTDKADDETDPFIKAVGAYAGKKAGDFGDFMRKSVINAATTHAGNASDYIEFFNKKSSVLSILLTQYTSDVSGDMDAYDDMINFEMQEENIKRHKLTPQAHHRAYDHYIKNAQKIDRNWVQLSEMYDPETKSLYFAFQCTDVDGGKTGLNASLAGIAWQNPKLYGTEFPYNKTGGKVPTPFLQVYEIGRDTMKAALEKYDVENIVFTGHSQGATLASMAPADDMFKGYNITTNAFGPATVGDKKFFQGLKENVGSLYNYNRINHRHDPITIIGNYSHYDNKIWDIAVGTDFNVYADVRYTPIGFFEFTGQVHSENIFQDAFINIGDGDLELDPKKGEFVGKSKFDNLAKFLYQADKFNIWDIMKMTKTFLQDHGIQGLKALSNLKNANFKVVVQSTKDVLVKAGMNIASSRMIENQYTKAITKNLDFAVLGRIRNRFKPEYKNMMAGLTDEHAKYIDDLFDFTSKSIDDIDILLDVDGIEKFDLDELEFKDGKKVANRMAELSHNMREFLDKTNIFKRTNYNPIADAFFEEELIDYNNPYKKLRDPSPTIQRATKTVGGLKTKIAKASRSTKRVVTEVRDIISTNTERHKYTKLTDDADRMREMSQKITKEIKEVRDIISTSIESHKYTKLTDDGAAKVKITPLTKRFAQFSNTTKDLMTQKMIKLREDVFPIKGVTGIKKGIARAKNVSQPIVNTGLDLMKKLIGKANKFGFTSAKMMKIVGKMTSKEALPAIGVGLEIGFTAAEIDEDLQRIEDEKAYVVWNGEVIFKLYNPEEYAQISALKVVYNTHDIDKQGVSFDSFLNTWYGRLSTDENGVLLIDGVRTDDPDFDVVYTETVTNIRGEGYTGSESKTLSVIKNVGLGLFNIALDMMDVIPAAVVASTTTAIATGVIDEVFEAQAISKKANGFTRAMKFKILNDSYHNVANEAIKNMGELVDESSKNILIDYLNAYIREKYSSTLPDNKPGLTRTSEELRKQLLDLGYTEWVLDSAITDIRDVERLYNIAPDIIKDTALTPVLATFTPFVAVGGIMDYELNRFKGVLSNLQEMGEQRKKATNVYNDLIEKYWDAYARERGVTKNGVKMKFDSIDPRRNYVSKGFLDQIKAYKELVDAQVDQIMKLVDEEVINQNEANTLLKTVYEGYEMDLKILDVTTMSNNSAYINDPGVKDAVHAFWQKSMESTKAQRDMINQTLLPLLQKHGTQEEGRNLELEMKLEIKKAEIRHLLKSAGFPEDHAYGEMLLQEFKNRNRDIFPLKEGEISITVDTEAIVRAGLGRARLNRAINDWETLENMQLGNIIRQEYLFITKVIDVYHDPRSIYANESDIIKFYQDQGIEIDVEKRLQMEQDFNIKRSVMGHLDAVFYSIFSEEGNISNFDEIPEEFDVPQEYRGHIDLIREIIKKAQESDDKDIKKTITTELEFAIDEGKESLNIGFKKQEQAQAIQQTDVLNEREQFDLGFADKDGKQSVKFQPTGKILPFTMDNGPPRMLFEDGKEKSYIGPKNALAGGIEQGYWIGVIPNGEHAPVNTLDNFFMAYHIESQEDPNIAKARFIARTKQAMTIETISQEKNYTEYQTALYTLAYLERNDHLFGLELTNEFMRNGIGATINTQLREEIGPDLRKGVLPDDVNNELLSKMEIEEEIDDSNVLKRAADFAKELGDDTMATQFDKISKSSTQMKRIADEYIGNIKKRQRILNNGEEKLPNGMDRLILEKSIETEDIKEKYTKLIIGSLGKQLFEFL